MLVSKVRLLYEKFWDYKRNKSKNKKKLKKYTGILLAP